MQDVNCEMRTVRSDEDLARVFADAGKNWGFDEVKAEFCAFRTLKIAWTRSLRRGRFQVSDYLFDAPEDVLKGMAECTFGRIRGEMAEYNESVVSYLSSEAFLTANQPVSLRRYPGFRQETAGRKKNLKDSLDRLVGAGLLEPDERLVIGWEESVKRSAGRLSVTMRVVGVSTALDSDRVSDTLLDYVVYSLTAVVQAGFSSTGRQTHGADHEALLDRYLDRAEAELELARLNLSL